MKWITLLLLFVFVQPFAQAIAPHWKYKVLKTPHFEIFYREDQKALAQRYAIASERAHELLMPVFKEGPSTTIVVIKDDTDSANGLANFLPYASIVIYPVLPVDADSIDEYGDWPLELMLHEYAHILNLYPAHGVYWPLKWILGSVVRPNAILPTWYLEGLAVNLESRYSRHGRLRSKESQAQARAFTLGGRWPQEDIARISEASIGEWPYGGRPYVFGGWWWDEAIRKKGEDVVYTWNQNFSRRIPFLLNGPVREQTELSVIELLKQAYQTQQQRSERELQLIQKSQPHPSNEVTQENSEQNVFALSPSGNKLVYWSGVYKKGNDVRLKVREKNGQPFSEIKSQRLFKAVSTLKVRWLNEDEFLFDQTDTKHPYVSYRDLYIYNLNTQTTLRLTEGARAQDASSSPSGNAIAFIQNDSGRTRLMWMDRTSKTTKSLITGNLSQRVGSPEFIDENTILFTVRQASGQQKIYSFDVNQRKTAVWFDQFHSPQSLRQTSEGLLLTDSTKGARNVYLIKNGAATAVSNTLTDIQRAEFDPQTKSLIVSELTPQGRRLKTFPMQQRQPAQIPPIQLATSAEAKISKVKIQEREFQPWRYLLPRYWIPFIYQVEEGYLFQGITSMSDPLGRNEYSLSGSYDSVTQRGSYGLSYVNHSTPVDIGLGYSKSQTYLGASGFTVETDSAFLNFATHWPWNSSEHQASLGGLWSQSQTTRSFRRLGPQVNYNYSNLGSPLREWFRYNLGLGHEQYLPQDGYLEFGRSTANLGGVVNLGGDYRIALQTRAAVAPDLPKSPRSLLLSLGESTLGGNYLVNLANSNFLLRGYPSGAFTGRSLFNSNLEFILPVREIARGLGTFPLFFRDVELAFFGDAVTLDGVAYDPSTPAYADTEFGEFYMGTGAELRLNTSIAYHLPVSFTIGLYYGLNDRFGGGFSPFIGIGMGSLGSIENKTP